MMEDAKLVVDYEVRKHVSSLSFSSFFLVDPLLFVGYVVK